MICNAGCKSRLQKETFCRSPSSYCSPSDYAQHGVMHLTFFALGISCSQMSDVTNQGCPYRTARRAPNRTVPYLSQACASASLQGLRAAAGKLSSWCSAASKIPLLDPQLGAAAAAADGSEVHRSDQAVLSWAAGGWEGLS